MKVYITNPEANAVDYTQYVVEGTLTVQDAINVPTVVNFDLAALDSTFVVPSQGAYVQIVSEIYGSNGSYLQSGQSPLLYGKVLATGFVTNQPEAGFLGLNEKVGYQKFGFQQLSYKINVTSDEWLLNTKFVPFVPAFVNQTQGQILANIAEALRPGVFDVTSFVASGDLIPYYQYDPTQNWSDIAKKFADGSRYRYKLINKVLYFLPFGDAPLGISYDEVNQTQSEFMPLDLSTQVISIPPVNDALVLGQQEPQDQWDNYFVGDGFTSAFGLLYASFSGSQNILQSDDWTETTQLKPDPSQWYVQDPYNTIALAGALNIDQKGLAASGYGQTYVVGLNGVEIGGALNIQAGEFEMVDTCSGIVGGVYTDSSLLQPTCFVGFQLSPSSNIQVTASGAAGIIIQPLLNGQPIGPTVVSQANHHYQLQIFIGGNQFARYENVYSNFNGTVKYGGNALASYGQVTWVVGDIDIGTVIANAYGPQSLGPPVPVVPVITSYTASGLVMPTFGVFAPLNGINLNLAVNYTLLAQPPQGSLWVATEGAPTTSQQLTIYGTAQPWVFVGGEGSINVAYPFSTSGGPGTNPTSFQVTPGTLYTITYNSGTVSRDPEFYGFFNANGDPSNPGPGSSNSNGWPGYWVEPIGAGSCNAGSLVGAWADETGELVANPFEVGNSWQGVAPAGASQLLLGVNDVTIFNDNVGSWTVTITSSGGYYTPSLVVSSASGGSLPILPADLGPYYPYLLGTGFENQAATLTQNGDTDELQFYNDTIPPVGARIRFMSWANGTAMARVNDPASIAVSASISGDDGTRSAIFTNLSPAPRTSNECELAAASLIVDRINPQFQGSYQVFTIPFYFEKMFTPNGVTQSSQQYAVLGTAMPWEFVSGVNAAFPFSTTGGIGTAPTALFVEPGQQYRLQYNSGTVSRGTPYGSFDANGDSSNPGPGSSNSSGWPGYWVTPTGAGSCNAGSLIGAWADDNGQLVAPPFEVGDSWVGTCPAGANQLLLGVNDVNIFSDNTGSWLVTFTASSVNDYPRSGRYFYCNSPARGVSGQYFFASTVNISVLELKQEVLQLSVDYGMDLFLEKTLQNFVQQTSSLLQPQETTVAPTPTQLENAGNYYLDPFPNPQVISISNVSPNASFITIDLGAPPASAAEVRRIDGGWGTEDQNFIGRFTTQQFTLLRSARDQTWYVRPVSGAQTSWFSYVPRVATPMVPSPPILVAANSSALTFDYNGDVRDIYGLEIRATPASGVTFYAVPDDAISVPLDLMERFQVGLNSVSGSLATYSPQSNSFPFPYAFEYQQGDIVYFNCSNDASFNGFRVIVSTAGPQGLITAQYKHLNKITPKEEDEHMGVRPILPPWGPINPGPGGGQPTGPPAGGNSGNTPAPSGTWTLAWFDYGLRYPDYQFAGVGSPVGTIQLLSRPDYYVGGDSAQPEGEYSLGQASVAFRYVSATDLALVEATWTLTTKVAHNLTIGQQAIISANYASPAAYTLPVGFRTNIGLDGSPFCGIWTVIAIPSPTEVQFSFSSSFNPSTFPLPPTVVSSVEDPAPDVSTGGPYYLNGVMAPMPTPQSPTATNGVIYQAPIFAPADLTVDLTQPDIAQALGVLQAASPGGALEGMTAYFFNLTWDYSDATDIPSFTVPSISGVIINDYTQQILWSIASGNPSGYRVTVSDTDTGLVYSQFTLDHPFNKEVLTQYRMEQEDFYANRTFQITPFNATGDGLSSFISHPASGGYAYYGGGGAGGFAECLDVRLFGAVGDGVTDDTAAIQGALTQAYINAQGSAPFQSNTIVCIPSTMTCLVTPQFLDGTPTDNGYGPTAVALTIGSGVTLQLDGKLVLGTPTGFSTVPWVILENLGAYNGGDTEITIRGAGELNALAGTESGCIKLEGVDSAQITGLQFVSHNTYAVYGEYCTQLQVIGIVETGEGALQGYTVLLDKCHQSQVLGCSVNNSGGGSLTFVGDYGSDGTLIDGNNVYALTGQGVYRQNYGFEDRIAGLLYSGLVISNNIFANGSAASTSILALYPNGASADFGVVARGNTITNNQQQGILLGNLTDCLILGNTVTNNVGGGIAKVPGTVLTSVAIKENVVKGNTAYDFPSYDATNSPVYNDGTSTVTSCNSATDPVLYQSWLPAQPIIGGAVGGKGGFVFPPGSPNTLYGVQPQSGSPTSAVISQSGTTTSIAVVAFTIEWPDKRINYTGPGTIPTAGYGTYYVFVDDPYRDGNASTIQYGVTNNQNDLATSAGRYYLGTVTTTPAGGGTGSVGGNLPGTSVSQSSTSGEPYDIGCTWQGTLSPGSTVILHLPMVRQVTFAAGLAGSQGHLLTAPASTVTISINKNGVQFGTMTFNAGSNYATFSGTGATLNISDLLEVPLPSSPDASASDLGFILAGTYMQTSTSLISLLLSDSLNNWADSILVPVSLLSFSDSLNNWADLIAVRYPLIQLALSDSLNFWNDAARSNFKQLSLFDNLNNWNDHTVGSLGSSQLVLSDNLNNWQDTVAFSPPLQLVLSDSLNNWEDVMSGFLD